MADITEFPIPTEVLDPANYPEFVGPTGDTGPAGPQGETGATGADGVGVPAGGTTGQVLAKSSATDYATEWVDQSGGGGSPGGSDTQVQFNDGGAFGGDAGLAYNKTTGSLTVGGKTVTTTAPIADLTQTWNASGTTFTGFKLNVTDTASSAGSLLADFQVGGVSRFSVNKNGYVNLGSNGGIFLYADAPNNISFGKSTDYVRFGNNKLYIVCNNAGVGQVRQTGFVVASSGSFSFADAGYDEGLDLILARDAAQTLAQRNGVNAQTFRLYGAFTDASNSRRLALSMTTGGVATIKPEGLGTGASGNVLHISGLPTSDPGTGILWNDGGIVKVGV